MATIYPFRREAQRIEEETTSYVGMVVFLASWAIMFAGLLFAYGYLRLRAPHWPPVGFPRLPLALPSLATIVLLGSSVVLHLALQANRQEKFTEVRRYLLATVALGALFLVLQVSVWLSLWQEGLRLRSGTYGAAFYMLTIFHALHVLCGVGVLAWLGRLAKTQALGLRRHTTLLMASMFWHFVDVVWVAMFFTVYLL